MRQIVALRVRSNLGTIAPYQPRAAAAAPAAAAAASADVEMAPADDPQAPPAAAAAPAAGAAAQQKMEREEIDYVAVLNRHLPEDIRVLRWSDVPGPDFSARFRCASGQSERDSTLSAQPHGYLSTRALLSLSCSLLLPAAL